MGAPKPPDSPSSPAPDETPAPAPDETFGTMQMPRGAEIPPARRAPTAAPVAPSASPVEATLRPAPDADLAALVPPPPPPPAVPEAARYALGDEIARGGMGRVVEAMDTRLGRTVAFKEALATDTEALRRFERETRITARLEHPSIVPVHDAGVSPTGQPYYVMRKISGRPLEKLVGEANTLPERLALIPHIVESARAIAHAHARGIVHRDIKPSNILVGDLGETIVIDWGLAKVIGEADELSDPAAAQALGADPLHTRAGVVFGTPGFMSPEQLRGAPVDEQCDVYALGATLYHLLARRPPHYAKTADEMMRAAVAAPPSPVSEFVAGVPPELETIVTKALAQTADARYASSRALAEDLQRFLTGQLVAAHRYSRAERLRRFLRQHRFEVGVAATAIAVMIILSAGFIHRILAERDRADAQARIALAERNAATERADQLVLEKARALSATSPTVALGLLAPLASSPRWWPQVRAIAAAARAAGVAYTLPGAPETRALELAHDGGRLLALGTDGSVRVHDLAARTTRVIADLPRATAARWTADDRAAVIARVDRLVIVDTTGAAPPREIPAAHTIASLAVAGDTAYWVDAEGEGWSVALRPGGAAPTRVPSEEPLRMIAPSPDGAWLAVAGDTHLFMQDRADPQAPLVAMTSVVARALVWAPDSTEVAALLPGDVLVVATGAPPKIVHRLDVGEQAAVALSGGAPYVVGPTGVAIANRDGVIPRKQLAGYGLGLQLGPRGALVAGNAQGTLAVLSEAGDPVLAATGPITAFAAAPQSRFVAAARAGSVLVWTLSDVLPRPITTAPPSAAALVDEDHVIATYPRRAAEWIDLRKDTSTDLGDLPGVAQIAPAPDGASAAIVSLTHALQIAAPGRAPQAIPGDVARVAYVADGRLAIASAAGLRLRARDGREERVADLPVALATRGGWLAAATADGALWRRDLATGRDERIGVGALPAETPLAVLDDGTVLVGAGPTVRAWPPGGALRTIATLPQRVRELHAVSGGRALALTETALAALDVPAQRVIATIAAAGSAAVADDAGLVVVRTSAGVLEVIDAFAGTPDGVRWTLASKPDVAFSAPRISRDGHRVLASTPEGLWVWALDLPTSAAATAAWLAALTTAPPGG